MAIPCNLSTASFNISPPRLLMTMADSTGIHPAYKAERVVSFLCASHTITGMRLNSTRQRIPDIRVVSSKVGGVCELINYYFKFNYL